MNASRRSWVLGSLLLLVAAGGAYIWYSDRPVAVNPTLSPFSQVVQNAAQPGLPVLFETPEFSFVDQNGAPASKNQLGGRVWIANFIFTNCGGACPKVTAQFVKLQQDIDEPELRFVTFTVDPTRDEPRVLKDYAQKHNQGENRWMLLRPPDQAAVMNVAHRMAAVQHAHLSDDTIPHTDFLVLVDEAGHVRGLYDSKSPAQMQRLKQDAIALVRASVLRQGATTQPGE